MKIVEAVVAQFVSFAAYEALVLRLILCDFNASPVPRILATREPLRCKDSMKFFIVFFAFVPLGRSALKCGVVKSAVMLAKSFIQQQDIHQRNPQ